MLVVNVPWGEGWGSTGPPKIKHATNHPKQQILHAQLGDGCVEENVLRISRLKSESSKVKRRGNKWIMESWIVSLAGKLARQ